VGSLTSVYRPGGAPSCAAEDFGQPGIQKADAKPVQAVARPGRVGRLRTSPFGRPNGHRARPARSEEGKVRPALAVDPLLAERGAQENVWESGAPPMQPDQHVPADTVPCGTRIAANAIARLG
jgi:hypothetical protein